MSSVSKQECSLRVFTGRKVSVKVLIRVLRVLYDSPVRMVFIESRVYGAVVRTTYLYP